MTVVAVKDPRKVAAGKAGMRARWGPEPRIVRLDDLTGPQRRLVLALVDAARREAATEIRTPVAAMSGGHGDDQPTD